MGFRSLHTTPILIFMLFMSTCVSVSVSVSVCVFVSVQPESVVVSISGHSIERLQIYFPQDKTTAYYTARDPAIQFIESNVVWEKPVAEEEPVHVTLNPDNGVMHVGAEDDVAANNQYEGMIFFSGKEELTDASQIEFVEVFDMTVGSGPTQNFVEWLGCPENRDRLAASRPNFERGSLSHKHVGSYYGTLVFIKSSYYFNMLNNSKLVE